MQPISNERIHQLLANALAGADIRVEGDGYKYFVTVVSDSFAGQNTLQRHKQINALLKEPIATGLLHALTIKTYTKAEWAGQSGS